MLLFSGILEWSVKCSTLRKYKTIHQLQQNDSQDLGFQSKMGLGRFGIESMHEMGDV